MILATITTTGWAVDKPRITKISISEQEVAFEKLETDGTKTNVLVGELYQAYKNRSTYIKENAGYQNTVITADKFEDWFYARYIPKTIRDRMIDIKYVQT